MSDCWKIGTIKFSECLIETFKAGSLNWVIEMDDVEWIWSAIFSTTEMLVFLSIHTVNFVTFNKI